MSLIESLSNEEVTISASPLRIYKIGVETEPNKRQASASVNNTKPIKITLRLGCDLY